MPLAEAATATVNASILLFVLVDMAVNTQAPGGELPGDPDAAIRQLYSQYGKALHGYVERFCPDRASADDIVQETFIRAWRHLPQLSADDRPVRPWLYRVARCDRAPGRRPGRDWQADHDQAVRRHDATRLQRASPVHLHR